MNTNDFFSPLAGVAAGIVALLFGAWTPALTLLTVLVVTDYVTGITAAATNQQLSSKKGFLGVAKKVLLFAIVGISHLIDQALNLNFVMQGTVFFYLSSEFISILENSAALGIPIPPIISKALNATTTNQEKGE